MVLCAVTSETVATMTWTELRERVTRLEAEVALRSTESRDSSARLERDLNRAARREADLTRQLQTVQRKLKRTERLLLKPGQYAICIKTSKNFNVSDHAGIKPFTVSCRGGHWLHLVGGIEK